MKHPASSLATNLEHIYESAPGGFRCTVCQQFFAIKPFSPLCPGARVYGYGKWPEGLFTKTQIEREHHLKLPAGTVPAGCYLREREPRVVRLYRLEDARPPRPLTEVQRETLARGRAAEQAKYTCRDCGYHDYMHGRGRWKYNPPVVDGLCPDCARRREDRFLMEQEARDLLREPASLLVLDTETTGKRRRPSFLKEEADEVIELAILNGTGKLLYSSLIQTQNPERADLFTELHGIAQEHLRDAPTFPEVLAQVTPMLLQAQTIVTYNASFDQEMLEATAQRYGLALPGPLRWHCLMHHYAAWHGDWSDYHGSYQWQSLETACVTLDIPLALDQSHRAEYDARQALAVLQRMAILHTSLHPDESTTR